MTNFEKWKSELTVEKLPALFNFCVECPVVKINCDGKCLDVLKKWANEEVQDERLCCQV